jgi:hypothetical protein
VCKREQPRNSFPVFHSKLECNQCLQESWSCSRPWVVPLHLRAVFSSWGSELCGDHSKDQQVDWTFWRKSITKNLLSFENVKLKFIFYRNSIMLFRTLIFQVLRDLYRHSSTCLKLIFMSVAY